MEAGERDGVILTTDADSQVAPNWIAENLAAFEAGAEAVLGRIDLDGEGELTCPRRFIGAAAGGQVRATAHGIVLAARPARARSVAPPRDNLGRKSWCHARGLLPCWALAPGALGRGQGFGRVAFATTMREFAIARLST